ncbi:MAG TPA: ribonuclease E/G [Stellaceae bacterium]|nr:ribonuclease E/G [Stellaceae bacterium]
MAKRMLIDAAHPEETRVVVLNGSRLEEFDFETSTKKQIKGNIYLAKVTRVEPSLQAAFVEYGGNRHGFLAFNEIHPDYYRIPVADRQAALDAERAAEHAANAREDAERDRYEREPAAGRDRPAPDTSFYEAFSDADEPDDDDHDHDDHHDDHDDGNGADRMAHDALSETIREPEPEPHDEPAAEAEAPRDEEPAHESPRDTFLSSPGEAPPEGIAADQDMGEPGGERGAEAEAAAAESLHAEAAQDERFTVAAVTHGDAIETVGGDEIEEATRPRARPFRHYKIQEVIKRRQIMLVQVTKEERGNKGAALTTYLSLAGRYCVLMPNTPRGGGVSRKITSATDRRRLKDLVGDLDVPEGMGVIVRTAGSERSKAEIKRDFEYLFRLWDEIRDLTLKSTAPALIYEEGSLIKRAIRDLYTRDIDDVVIDGEEGYRTAKTFMKMLMPSHAKRVKLYRDPGVPLFQRHQIEPQIDAIHSPVVQLRSGGYIVLNPTEALVAIDVNSGRSTKERNIEETALKTNLEAADEVARQLRLRDLAGLIVIDLIDMEEYRNRAAVERRLKEAMRHDRARIQLGRISPFGLLEMSRQRLRPSLVEASTAPCPYCNGTGHIRSIESAALHVLRAIEEEGMRRRSAEITVTVPGKVALYILNQKRATLQQIEARFGMSVIIGSDDTLVPPAFRLERMRALTPAEIAALPNFVATPEPAEEEDEEAEEAAADDDVLLDSDEVAAGAASDLPPRQPQPAESEGGRGRGDHGPRHRRRRRGHRDEAQPASEPVPFSAAAAMAEKPYDETAAEPEPLAARTPAPREARPGESASEAERRRRRRGRRGGRRRRRDGQPPLERGAENGAPEGDSFEHDIAAHDESVPGDAMPPMQTNGEVVLDIGEPFETPPAPAVAAEPHHEEPAPTAPEPPPALEIAPPPPAPVANPRRGWWRR